MHFSRRNLLLASSAAALFGRSTASRAASPPPKYFVVVFANGGWDVTYNLDPKQGALASDGSPTPIEGPVDEPEAEAPEAEEVLTFGNIAIQANDVTRPAATEFFQKWSTRCHVINGIWTGSIAHAPCRIRIFTGSTNQLNPDSATIFGYSTAATEPLGAIDLSGLSYPGPLAASTGRIGFQSQIKALVDPESIWPGPDADPGYYPLFRPLPPTFVGATEVPSHEQAAIDAFLQTRASAFGALRADGGANDARVAGLLESRDRAARFKSEGGKEAFDPLILGKTPSFQTQAYMAAEMFSKGLCRAVVLNSGSDWDTHIANAAQHGFYNSLYEGLEVLATALTEAGLFEDTLVVVMSEMTRTPQFNLSAGKDHHAHTSALMFGGAVRGGETSGATDNDGLESLYMDLATGAVDPDPNGAWCKYDNFTAGLLTMLGLDSQEWLPGVTPFLGAAKT